MPSSSALRTRIEARLAEQRRLVTQLLELRDQLPGSVFARYGRCGKSNCSCAEGRGHGPYYVLSNRSGGQGSFMYIGRGRVTKTRELVHRYKRFKVGLSRLHALNDDLVALLREYQQFSAADAARALSSRSAQEKSR
jgi:hypothetical protein